MRRPAWTQKLPLLSTLVGMLVLGSFHAWGKPNLSPGWVREAPEVWLPNVSIMDNRSVREEPHFTQGLLRRGDLLELRNEYMSLTNDYEAKRLSLSLDMQAERDQRARVEELSRKLMNRVRNYQRDKSTARLKKVVTSIEAIQKPMAVAVAVFAYSSGTPVRADLSEDTELWGFSNVAHGVTYLEVRSPFGRGSVTYSVAPSGAASMFPAPPEWLVRDERYRFALSKDLPFLNMGTGLAYGLSSNTVVASVSRALAPHLIAEMASRMPVSASSTLRTSEESVKLTYKVLF